MTRTPDGYDSETGEPIASTGGGYDPDADTIRERRPWYWVFGATIVGVVGVVAQWCGP